MQKGARLTDDLATISELFGQGSTTLAQGARRLDRISGEHPLLTAALEALDRALVEAGEAETKLAIMSTWAAAARSAPRALGTKPVKRTPGLRCTCAITCMASAICGTALGDTNDVVSKLCTPASIKPLMTSTLRSVGMKMGSA